MPASTSFSRSVSRRSPTLAAALASARRRWSGRRRTRQPPRDAGVDERGRLEDPVLQQVAAAAARRLAAASRRISTSRCCDSTSTAVVGYSRRIRAAASSPSVVYVGGRRTSSSATSTRSSAARSGAARRRPPRRRPPPSRRPRASTRCPPASALGPRGRLRARHPHLASCRSLIDRVPPERLPPARSTTEPRHQASRVHPSPPSVLTRDGRGDPDRARGGHQLTTSRYAVRSTPGANRRQAAQTCVTS